MSVAEEPIIKCYYQCGRDLVGENVTDEHIVLNAVGGRLSSERLICKTCNSKAGETIDAALAKQLHPFTNLYNVKRQHGGAAPPLRGKGEHGSVIDLVDGGKPVFVRPMTQIATDDGVTSVSIQARDIEQMRHELRRLASKHPELGVDVEEALKTAQSKTEFLDGRACCTNPLRGSA